MGNTQSWTAETRPASPGRPKGKPNKVTADIKAMVEEALERAGGAEYLSRQALENPPAFLALVGKMLPKDIKLEATIATHAAIAQAAAEIPDYAVRAALEAIRLHEAEKARAALDGVRVQLPENAG